MRILSLCTGVGMLDMGVELAVPSTRTVCYVERSGYAAALLSKRISERAIQPAPIWDDLTTFNAKPWRGLVDCVIGGFPCQPFSNAGKRLGAEDPRHLFPHIARHVKEIRPQICFFENVRGHLRLGFREVRDELRSMGYSVRAGLFTAEETGAKHERCRLFILAYTEHPNRRDAQCGEECTESSHRFEGPSGELGNTHNSRLEESRYAGERELRKKSAEGLDAGLGDCRCELADDKGQRCVSGRLPVRAAEKHTMLTECFGDVVNAGRKDLEGERRRGNEAGRQESDGHVGLAGGEGIPIYAYGPNELNKWAELLQRRPDLAPATEPGVRLLVDGVAGMVGQHRVAVDEHRTEQLVCIGNGVTPLSAALAFITLAESAGIA